MSGADVAPVYDRCGRLPLYRQALPESPKSWVGTEEDMRWRRRRSDPCVTIAGQLDIPQPFDLAAFCQSIAAQRGRPLLLLPLDGPPQPDLPCGIWIGLEEADLVFYEQNASELLRVQIILHEISHMLLGHVAPQVDLPEDASQAELDQATAHFEQLLARTATSVDSLGAHIPAADLMRAEADRLQAALSIPGPGDEDLELSESRILNLLGRTKFNSAQEQDAETLATLMLERISRNEARATSDEASDVINRLSDAFVHPARTHRNR